MCGFGCREVRTGEWLAAGASIAPNYKRIAMSPRPETASPCVSVAVESWTQGLITFVAQQPSPIAGINRAPPCRYSGARSAYMVAQSAKHGSERTPRLGVTPGENETAAPNRFLLAVALVPAFSWDREERAFQGRMRWFGASQWLPKDACAAVRYPCGCARKGARVQGRRTNGRPDPAEGRRDEPKEERAARESMPPFNLPSIHPIPGLHQHRRGGAADLWRMAPRDGSQQGTANPPQACCGRRAVTTLQRDPLPVRRA